MDAPDARRTRRPDPREAQVCSSGVFWIYQTSLIARVVAYGREWLTLDEIKHALETEGGLDIDVVELKEPMDTITHLVFVTGHTGRHLRRMADILVRAVEWHNCLSRDVCGAMADKLSCLVLAAGMAAEAP